MAWNNRIRDVRQLPIEQMQVGAADTAGQDLDQDLLLSGSRRRQFHCRQRPTGSLQAHRFHGAM